MSLWLVATVFSWLYVSAALACYVLVLADMGTDRSLGRALVAFPLALTVPATVVLGVVAAVQPGSWGKRLCGYVVNRLS